MSSPAKIRANKLNATKSTCPKTPQGKRRVSQNALDMGLHAKTILLPTENWQEYRGFLNAYLELLKPQGQAELRVATEIADSWWKLGRVNAGEKAYLEDLIQIEAARDKFEDDLIDISGRRSDENPKEYRRRIDEQLLEEGAGSTPMQEHLRTALKRTVSDEDHMHKSHAITLKRQGIMRSIRFAEDALEKMQARRLTIVHSQPTEVANADSLQDSDFKLGGSDQSSGRAAISKADPGDESEQDLTSQDRLPLATNIANAAPVENLDRSGHDEHHFAPTDDKAVGAEQERPSSSFPNAIMEKVSILCEVLGQSTSDSELTSRWADELAGLMVRFDWERHILPAAHRVHALGVKPPSVMFLCGSILKIVDAEKAGAVPLDV